MKDFSIDLIWAKVQIAITALGGWLGYFLGGMDGLMILRTQPSSSPAALQKAWKTPDTSSK